MSDASVSGTINVTSRRYTENDIEAFEHDPTKFTLQVRLEDRFGDNGMISVISSRKIEMRGVATFG